MEIIEIFRKKNPLKVLLELSSCFLESGVLGLVHLPGGFSVACGLFPLRAGRLLLHDRGSGGTVRRVSYAIYLCSALRWAFHFAAVGCLVPANVLAWSAPEGIAPWTARAQTSDRPSPSPVGAGPLHEVFPDLPGCPSSAPPLPFPPAAPDLGATSTPQTSMAWVALSEMSAWRSLQPGPSCTRHPARR